MSNSRHGRSSRRNPFDAPAGTIAVLAYEYPHGHHIPAHAHLSHQLVYASSGAMSVHTDAGAFVVPPSHAVWVPSALRHAIDMSGAVSMRTLYIAPNLWSRAFKDCRVLPVSQLLRSLILTAVDRGGLRKRRARDGRLIAVLLDELAAGTPLSFHMPFPRDARARRVAGRVQQQPGARRPLWELAQGTGASPRTLERLFRSEVGLSFGQWRKQLRLMHGLRRLAAGDNVTAAAMEAGYASVSAAFRAAFGATPGSYTCKTGKQWSGRAGSGP